MTSERTFDGLLIDVVERGARVVLAELLAQGIEVGELGEGLRGIGQAHRLAACHALAPVPGQIGPQGAQAVVEPGHLGLQVHVGQRRGHEVLELGALLGGERVHEALHCRRLARKFVEKLLEGLGTVREELAVLVHELVEVLGDVAALAVLVEHCIEVAQHLLHGLLRLGRAHVADRLAHLPELLIHDVGAQALLDLLVDLAGLGRSPLVVGELGHRARGLARQVVELGLPEPGIVGRVGEERRPFERNSLIEHFGDVGEQAVEASGFLQLAPALLNAAAQLVEPAASVRAPSHQ